MGESEISVKPPKPSAVEVLTNQEPLKKAEIPSAQMPREVTTAEISGLAKPEAKTELAASLTDLDIDPNKPGGPNETQVPNLQGGEMM